MAFELRPSLIPACISLALAILLCSCSQADKPPSTSTAKGDSRPGAASETTNPQLETPDGNTGLPAPPTRGPINFARVKEIDRQKRLLEKYQCKTSQCASEVLGASKPEEAAWLQSRGFPTSDEEAELERMSLGQLQLSADRGDQKAQSILGRRLMQQGDQLAGLTRISDAAADGSVYADYQLSLGYRNTNVIDSAAYLRRAYLQGDTKAAETMYRTFSNFSPLEWKMVDERAMQLYGALLAQRSNKGRMQYGPRP